MAALAIPVAILGFRFNTANHRVKQSASDKPFVSPMFSDNMVLQREMADPVWGWSTPGAKITVSMLDKTATAVAGADGRWQTKIGPFPVGGPYTLNVAGPSSISFTNVMVGDVWICSGQSNMEFGIGNIADPKPVIDAANYPNLRLYRVPKLVSLDPVPYTSGSWVPCTPNNLKTDGDWNGFSAVAYFFGKKLQQDLSIPIGLVHTSWGGTPAQAWTSAKVLGDRVADYRPALAQIAATREANKNQAMTMPEMFSAWYKKWDKGSASDPGWAATDVDDSGWKSMNVPEFFQKSGLPEFNNQMSVVWFRKTVDVTADQAAKEASLHFVADDNDMAWVNGVKVGATESYNAKRAYKIPAGVIKAGKNVIAIRVTDTSQPGGIWGEVADLYLGFGGADQITLAGSWKLKLGTIIDAKNALPASLANNPNVPTVLYNGMIEPLLPYAVKGAIWYQGESNAGQAYQYRSLLPAMIESWHKNWGQGDFPFYIVQLAGFTAPPKQPGDDSWAELREAQEMTAKHVRNAGIATAFDIGEQNDIHPKNKEEVGRRLALTAEAKTYRMKVPYSGPDYKSMRVEGATIRISFDHLDGGLVVKDGALKGFSIAGADRKWYWADAKVDGDTVVVTSPMVPTPVAVRYGWAAFMYCNLYNKADLPAMPFRTDNWPGITGGPKR